LALGEKLKDLRLRKGQSLQQVADAVGSSKAHIWELETGKSKNPSIELLTKLAENYDVSVAHLIGEAPGSADEEPELIAMFRDFKGLTENDRATIRLLMKGLKARKKEKSEKD
jgi:transcriptional regulator with XRE-family HTH domain